MDDRDLEETGMNRPNIETYKSENPHVKVIKSPEAPTAEEIEKHNASGHVPFRSWCPICVEGAANDDPHYKQPPDNSVYPRFSYDYALMSSKNSLDKLTLFVIKEKKSKSIFQVVVPRKGTSETDVAT